jgi:hypothetical protein
MAVVFGAGVDLRIFLTGEQKLFRTPSFFEMIETE